MLYLAIYAGLSFFHFIHVRNIYLVVFFSLLLFSAFRFEVGCDWLGYLYQFRGFDRFFSENPVGFLAIIKSEEPLWLSLFAAMHWLGLPYPWINVFSSTIFFLGAHILARRQPGRFAFLILLFPILIINMPMSGIRQGAAIGIMCMAFVAFIDRRLMRFAFLTLVAASFHASAMVFMFLAPFMSSKYSIKHYALAVVFATFGVYALFSTSAVDVAISRYFDSGRDAFGAAFRTAVLAATAIFFFLFLRKKWQVVFQQDYKLVMVGTLMMLGVFMMVPISTIIGDRLSYYLIPIQAMIFARLPYLPLRKNRKLLIAAPHVGLLLMFAVWISLSWHFNLCYMPYQTWLFGFPRNSLYDF